MFSGIVEEMAQSGWLSKEFLYKKILKLSQQEIEEIQKQIRKEKKSNLYKNIRVGDEQIEQNYDEEPPAEDVITKPKKIENKEEENKKRKEEKKQEEKKLEKINKDKINQTKNELSKAILYINKQIELQNARTPKKTGKLSFFKKTIKETLSTSLIAQVLFRNPAITLFTSAIVVNNNIRSMRKTMNKNVKYINVSDMENLKIQKTLVKL